MSSEKKDTNGKHLRIYNDRSEYFVENTSVEVFTEGTLSVKAKVRIKSIKDAFRDGFLERLICDLRAGKMEVNMSEISPDATECINGLVDSLTSEVGRALIGLSVMQLCIKTISPEQNVRLHKGGVNRGAFSWNEGISMRTLDKNFVTPTLRKYELLRLNADGFMMTRSLAENYPYTFLYKAKLRGAREQWLTLVEELEKQQTNPLESLKLMISRLLNAASTFSETADKLLMIVGDKIDKISNRGDAIDILLAHSESSDYAARLLEINMHALMQAAVSTGALGDVKVKPLSQMRSANKKHGNIGDIELLDNDEIIEAWDAKYGKSYLREEIEEAVEKLQDHNHVQKVGFVTNTEIERSKEIYQRIQDVENLYSVDFEVLTFSNWVDQIYQRCLSTGMINEADLSQRWVQIYGKYLGQKRRDQAPIDEPCLEWVTGLITIFKQI